MRTALTASVAALVLAAVPLPAQTLTAYKTGERTTGMTKQCFYDGLGSEYTRTASSIARCPLSIQVTTRNPASSPSAAPAPRSTLTAYSSGEETTGTTKQCFYDGLGSRYTKTVQAYQICPLRITVER